MEFFKKVTQFPFMGQRKVWYGLSSVLVVGSIVLTFMHGLNLGIDFTGGVVVEYNYSRSADLEATRQSLHKAGFPDVAVQSFGTDRDVLVRLPPGRNKTFSEKPTIGLLNSRPCRSSQAVRPSGPLRPMLMVLAACSTIQVNTTLSGLISTS